MIINYQKSKNKKIKSIEKFYDTKILIDTDDKFPNDITLENVVILDTYIIKGDVKFYLQIFLVETLLEHVQQYVHYQYYKCQ